MGIVIEQTREDATEPHLPPRSIPARNRRLIALLDSFDAADADQQQRDLAQLTANLAESRTGQRQLFAENPVTTEDPVP